MSRMVMCMDAFTDDQTRLVVIVDGLDSCEQEKVSKVFVDSSSLCILCLDSCEQEKVWTVCVDTNSLCRH